MGLGIKMIDIKDKEIQKREAVARGEIALKKETIVAIKNKNIKKGDVLTIAQTAGIQAAKNAWNIIPLCHQIPIHYIDVQFKINRDRIIASCIVRADYKTGVEMDALVGVTVSLLTVWDMVKYLEKDKRGYYPDTSIVNIKVVKKTKTEIK